MAVEIEKTKIKTLNIKPIKDALLFNKFIEYDFLKTQKHKYYTEKVDKINHDDRAYVLSFKKKFHQSSINELAECFENIEFILANPTIAQGDKLKRLNKNSWSI